MGGEGRRNPPHPTTRGLHEPHHLHTMRGGGGTERMLPTHTTGGKRKLKEPYHLHTHPLICSCQPTIHTPPAHAHLDVLCVLLVRGALCCDFGFSNGRVMISRARARTGGEDTLYQIAVPTYVYMCICVNVYMCICVYVYMCICVDV